MKFKKSQLLSLGMILMLLSPLILAFINAIIIIYTSSSFSFSTLARLLIFFIVSLTFLYTKIYRLKLFLIVSVFYWLLCVFYWAIFVNHFNFVREVEQLLKVIIPFMLIFFFAYVTKKENENNQRLLEWVSYFGLIGGCMIIFSFFTGINVEEIRHYEFGISSFFVAKNEISLSLLLTCPITLFLFVQRKKMKYVIILLFTIGGMFLLGNKSAFLGAFIVILCFSIAFVYFPKREIKWSLENRFFVFSLLIGASVVFSLAAFYITLEYPYMVKDFMLLLEKSPREYLITIASNRIDSRPYIMNIFGEGAYSFGMFIEGYHASSKVSGVGKLAEQDFYDMIGIFGYVLGGFWLLFPIYFLLKSGYLFLIKKSVYYFTFFVGLFLFVGHSFTAGHGMMSPMVGTMMSVYYYFVLFNRRIMD